MSFKIDGSDPNNLSNKVLDEKTTRRKIIAHARSLGIEKDMQMLFDKADNLLRNCTNEKERADIGKLMVFETYSLLDRGGQLYVDGQLVYDDRSPEEQNNGGLIKLK